MPIDNSSPEGLGAPKNRDEDQPRPASAQKPVPTADVVEGNESSAPNTPAKVERVPVARSTGSQTVRTERTAGSVAPVPKPKGDLVTLDSTRVRTASVLPEVTIAPASATVQSPLAHSPLPARHTRLRKRGQMRMLQSLLLFVVLPVLVSTIYFGFLASDQYVSRAKFAIRSQGAAAPEGIGAKLGGGGGDSGGSPLDMIIVREYIMSRQLLEDIRPYLDLRKIYSSPNADWFSRLNPNLREEQFLEYWKSRVTIQDAPIAGYSELIVRAFTAEDAKAIAERVLLLSEELVNGLSERSRADAVARSKKDVDSSYERLAEARTALQNLQQSTKQIDPAAFAKTASEIQGRLNSDLITYRSQLETLRTELPDDAPGVVQLKNRIAALENQLATQRALATTSPSRESEDKILSFRNENQPALATPHRASAGEILNDYEKLKVDYEFAESGYLSALGSLGSARAAATRQSRYLEAFVRPQLPEYPEFPRRIFNVFVTGIAAVVLWAVGTLFVAAAKEHL